MEFFSKALKQSAAVFNALEPRKKVFFLLTILFTVGSLSALIIWTQKTDYEILYTGLSTEDAGEIITQLRDSKVPYKIGPGGTSIMVPKNQVYETRMQMASKGFPQTGGMGYELFDQQSIGVTEFVQKINFRRALQGELCRTVNEIKAVKRSRIHLTLPEQNLYLDEQEKPSASVVLTLYAGKKLQRDQLQGISHLVASSVENLDHNNVTIVDSHGKLLSGGEEDTLYGRYSSSQAEIQKAVERRTERKIISMLAGVVGPDKVTAKVSALMDFTQIEQTEESYDPETLAVRSEQRSEEKSKNRKPAASGVPGVMSNSPDIEQPETGQARQNTQDFNKTRETINYEISRVTKKVVKPTGTIQRLTTAVLIDGTYTMAKGEDGKDVRKYVPRSDEEMKKYKNLIEKAVGFNEDRGDSIEVVNVQFRELALEKDTFMDKTVGLIDWSATVRYLFMGLLFVIFLFVGLKPMIRILNKTLSEIPSGKHRMIEGGGGSAEEIGELPAIGESEGTNKQRQIVDFAKKNPRLFAQYLKTMMR